MALTTEESDDVNALLRWLLGLRDTSTANQSSAELERAALDAGAGLADKAHKALSAGLTGRKVREAWPRGAAVPHEAAPAEADG